MSCLRSDACRLGSCEITPRNYFLCGYVNSLVYVDESAVVNTFEYHIRRVIADIRLQLLQKMIENWSSLLKFTSARRYLPDIIFKT